MSRKRLRVSRRSPAGPSVSLIRLAPYLAARSLAESVPLLLPSEDMLQHAQYGPQREAARVRVFANLLGAALTERR